MKKLITIIISFFFAINVFAQSTSGSLHNRKSEIDSLKCLEEVFLFNTFYEQENYKEAHSHWEKIVNSCPYSWNAIFNTVYLQNIFDYLISTAVNEDQKNHYIDDLLNVVEKRHLYFPKSYSQGSGIGLSAYFLIRYAGNDKKEVEKAYKMLLKSIEMEKEKTPPHIWDNFLRISEQMVHEKRDTALIIKAFELAIAYFEQNKTNLTNLKKMLQTLTHWDCTQSKVFAEIVSLVHQLEPNAQTANLLGYYSLNSGDYDTALIFFKEAIELTTTHEQKVDIWYSIGLIYQMKENYPEARNAALQAINLDPNCGKAYILIGDMYAASDTKCSGINRLPLDYNWAAADKYTRAIEVDPSVAEQASIKRAQLRFPSQEDKFQRGLTKSGTLYKIECWIQETTTVR